MSNIKIIPTTKNYLFGLIIAFSVLFVSGCEEKNNILPANQEPIFFLVEQMPEFPGGTKALEEFIHNAVKHNKAFKQGIQGKVYVSFIINEKGEVSDVRIARGVNPELDEEALRIIRSLPKWKPGTMRGVPVNVQFTVPINFTLQ